MRKLAILETGAPPEGPRQIYGDYPSMFRNLLGQDAYHYTTFDVAAGALPSAVDDHDAYLVTGSSAGVYDSLPWINPLKSFLVSAKRRVPLVGVCFGHQIMAQAFGGQVIKSPKGWGVGLHSYEVRQSEPWMDPTPTITVPASHQDQVVIPPPGATVLASSDFTPFGMLAYGNHAASIQLHPEFEPAYAKALIEDRRGNRYTDAQADQALASFQSADDRSRVGGWLNRFLQSKLS
jgi:GMP synthase-like glutamine amidotransferase